jgi:CHAT domain-containing protein
VELQLTPMAEVTGKYDSLKVRNLESALEEGRAVRDLYGAQHVAAVTDSILSCLHEGSPPASTIHVALHGQWSATNAVSGLIMMDENVLTANAVSGAEEPAPYRPFVFLNACQVGEGNQVLGNYAGLPAAFLYARARGVVAPLWSIDDAIAKEIALRFYASLKAGVPAAKILRLERKRFLTERISTTYLAYIYFGSPASRVTPETHVQTVREEVSVSDAGVRS